MAVPTKGAVTWARIYAEVYSTTHTSQQCSMNTMAAAATPPFSHPVSALDWRGYSAASDITMTFGAETSYSYGSYRVLNILNRVSPQIININFTWKVGWTNSTFYIYSSRISTSSWTQEVYSFAGSHLSGVFSVPSVDYNDPVYIRWSPNSASWSAFGANISLNNGTLTSGTPVVSVTGTDKWYIL